MRVVRPLSDGQNTPIVRQVVATPAANLQDRPPQTPALPARRMCQHTNSRQNRRILPIAALCRPRIADSSPHNQGILTIRAIPRAKRLPAHPTPAFLPRFSGNLVPALERWVGSAAFRQGFRHNGQHQQRRNGTSMTDVDIAFDPFAHGSLGDLAPSWWVDDPAEGESVAEPEPWLTPRGGV